MTHRRMTLLAAALLFVGIFHMYLRSLPPTVAPYRDAGEMATQSVVLGIAHPPGYPLYILMGRIATVVIPWGDRAYRLAVLSAAAGSAAAVMLALVILLLAGRVAPGLSHPGRLALACLCGMLAACSDKLWYLSQVQEMYALNALFFCLVTCAILAWLRRPEQAALLYAAAFLLGLGLGCRLDLLLAVVPVIGIALWGERRIILRQPRVLLTTAACGALGLSVYAYLLVRANIHPLLNWNDPSNIAQFIATVTRKTHGHTLDLLSVNYAAGALFLTDMGIYLAELSREFSVLGIPLMAAGAWALWRRARIPGCAIIAGWMVAGPLFIYMANMPPNPHALAILEAHFLLPNIAAFIIAGCGCMALAEWIARRGAARWAVPGAALLLFAGCAQNYAAAATRRAMRGNLFAYDYTRNVLASPPDQSLVLAKEDVQIFSLWYAQLVTGARPGIVCLAKGLSGSPWYQRHVMSRAGVRLARLDTQDGWERLTSLNPGRPVFATGETGLPSDFSLAVTPAGLLRAIGGPPADAGQLEHSRRLLSVFYRYRAGYQY